MGKAVTGSEITITSYWTLLREVFFSSLTFHQKYKKYHAKNNTQGFFSNGRGKKGVFFGGVLSVVGRDLTKVHVQAVIERPPPARRARPLLALTSTLLRPLNHEVVAGPGPAAGVLQPALQQQVRVLALHLSGWENECDTLSRSVRASDYI